MGVYRRSTNYSLPSCAIVPASEPSRSEGAIGLLSGIRVLIVEDDEDNRFLFQESLQVLGAAVEAVPTAGDAVDVLNRFDVIVADYDLPDHDGVWLLEQAMRLAPSIPIICLSGYAESQANAIASAPFARKLLKPVDAADLGLEIVKALAVSNEPPASLHAVRTEAG